MATKRDFGDMLTDYLPYELLKEELLNRNYVLKMVPKDDEWTSGSMDIAFKGAGASSVRAGKFTASDDIAQSVFVKGVVPGYKEITGSMIFNFTDLVQHEDLDDRTFLKILPDEIEDFVDYMSMVVSVNLGTGPSVAAVTEQGKATTASIGDLRGSVQVTNVDRFVIGQKIRFQGATGDAQIPATGAYFVQSIDINGGSTLRPSSGRIWVSTARATAVRTDAGALVTAALVDLSAITTSHKVYLDGFDRAGTSCFTSLRQQLVLDPTKGGTTSLFGKSKILYPYLQSVQISGTGVTAKNLLSKLFYGYATVKMKARGMADTILMSYKHWATAIDTIEVQKGAFNVVPNSLNATQYGWSEIKIGSVKGSILTLVGIQEMDDDVIFFIDWSAMKFHTNDYFRRVMSPDGNYYHSLRTEDGYQFITDWIMYGELVVFRPNRCAVMHSIPDYVQGASA